MGSYFPDGVPMSQVVYQKILDTYAGQNFQAVYMPKIYYHITSYLLSKWGIEKYQKLGDYIETVIKKVTQFNCDVESNTLSLEQTHINILSIVDYTLGISNLVRTFGNRLECANALFLDHQNTFSEWLRNYQEDDRKVVEEVQQYLMNQAHELEYNLEKVKYNIGLGYFPCSIKSNIN